MKADNAADGAAARADWHAAAAGAADALRRRGALEEGARVRRMKRLRERGACGGGGGGDRGNGRGDG